MKIKEKYMIFNLDLLKKIQILINSIKDQLDRISKLKITNKHLNFINKIIHLEIIQKIISNFNKNLNNLKKFIIIYRNFMMI